MKIIPKLIPPAEVNLLAATVCSLQRHSMLTLRTRPGIRRGKPNVKEKE